MRISTTLAIIATAAILSLTAPALALDNYVTKESKYSVSDTIDRLEKVLKSKRPNNLCPHRPRGWRQKSQPRTRPHTAINLRQPKTRHTANAIQPNHRHRPAAESPRLERRRWQSMADLQQSGGVEGAS